MARVPFAAAARPSGAAAAAAAFCFFRGGSEGPHVKPSAVSRAARAAVIPGPGSPRSSFSLHTRCRSTQVLSRGSSAQRGGTRQSPCAALSEKGVRLAQNMRICPSIPVVIQLEKAEVGPTSGPTWHLSHLVGRQLHELRLPRRLKLHRARVQVPSLTAFTPTSLAGAEKPSTSNYATRT
jgi:hypothetical protein